MEIRPITLKQANDFVNEFHRHHKGTVSHKFSIGLWEGEKMVGCAICGRPVARALDNGLTCEVNRLCTDGTRNACSMLYGASCRVAKAMGYKRVVTYTLESEPGASLLAAGFSLDGYTGLKNWGDKSGGGKRSKNRQKRSKTEDQPFERKKRWIKNL